MTHQGKRRDQIVPSEMGILLTVAGIILLAVLAYTFA